MINPDSEIEQENCSSRVYEAINPPYNCVWELKGVLIGRRVYVQWRPKRMGHAVFVVFITYLSNQTSYHDCFYAVELCSSSQAGLTNPL